MMPYRYSRGTFKNGFGEVVTPELLSGHVEEAEIRRQLEELDAAGRALQDAFGEKHFRWTGPDLEIWEMFENVCWQINTPTDRDTSIAFRFACRTVGVDEYDVIAMAAAIPAIAEAFPVAERNASDYWSQPDWILTPSGGKEWN